MARHEQTANAGYHTLQTASQLRRDQHGSAVGPSSAARRPRVAGRPEVPTIAAAGRHVVAEPGRRAVACSEPERLLPTVPAVPRVDPVVEPHALRWSRRVPGVLLTPVQAVSGKEPTVTVRRTKVRGQSAHVEGVDACTGGVVDSTRTVPSRTRAKNHVRAHKQGGAVCSATLNAHTTRSRLAQRAALHAAQARSCCSARCPYRLDSATRTRVVFSLPPWTKRNRHTSLTPKREIGWQKLGALVCARWSLPQSKRYPGFQVVASVVPASRRAGAT